MKPRPGNSSTRSGDTICLKHYSSRTENFHAGWIRRSILFHGKRRSNEMGAPEVEAFLTRPAINEHVAASPQNRVLSALLFLPDSLAHQYPQRSARLGLAVRPPLGSTV